MAEESWSGQRISDVCLLVQDLDRAIEFYRDVVGFRLRRLAPGFADFFTDGVTLALWQAQHMETHLGLPAGSRSGTGSRVMTAIQVATPAAVVSLYEELSSRKVPFLVEPRSYPWNAFACYFADPKENLWEIYSWQEGGHANLIFDGESISA